MKIHKEELDQLISESVIKCRKKLQIEAKIQELEKSLNILNETALTAITPAPMQDVMQDTGTNTSALQSNNNGNGKPEKKESIFDAKIDGIIVFNFQGVTIKLKRVNEDLFKVIDSQESLRIKEGDYVQIKGNDIIENGRQFVFTILRKAIPYKSPVLQSWRIVK